jgi:hypothetical protein
MRIYGLIAGIAGWLALLEQYLAVDRYDSLALTINFFSYFSTLSNIMAALVMTSAAFQKGGRRFWLTKPFAATAVALYIGVTGLPFIIESAWSGFGLQNIADFRLHYVMPSLYLIFWALFVPEGKLRVRDVLLWLIVPLVFAILALVHGWFTGFYPLLFLDLRVWSFPHVLASMGLMLVVLLTLGGLLLLLDHLLGWLRLGPQ